MISILIASIAVMTASLIGVISVWKHLGDLIEKNTSFLVSFSAGVFLIISLNLSNETILHSSFFVGGFWIVLGIILMFLLFKFLPDFHHHHDEMTENSHHHHSKIDARRVLVGDAIHNIGDGILLTTSFLISLPVGIAVTASIFIHELVQEISEFFVLRQAGFSIKKSLILNFIVSGTILVGAMGSFFLLEIFEFLEIPLLGMAAGSFFVVVFYDLIPESIRSSNTKVNYLKHSFLFILGVLIMFGVNSYFVHEHEDDHGDEKENSEIVEYQKYEE